MCTADCECEKCKNTEANDRPGGSRNKAVAEIMLRRPDAFKETVRINPRRMTRKKKRMSLSLKSVSILPRGR